MSEKARFVSLDPADLAILMNEGDAVATIAAEAIFSSQMGCKGAAIH